MEAFHKTLRNLQVIILALAAGLLILVAIMMHMVLNVKPGGFVGGLGPQFGGLPLLTTVLVGVAVLTLLLSFVLPKFMIDAQISLWKKQVRPIEGELTSWETSDLAWLNRVPAETLSKLLMIFQTSRIVVVSLCEAAGMLSVIAYLLEAHTVALVMAGVAIILMVWHVPTQSSLSSWVFTQIERLKREN